MNANTQQKNFITDLRLREDQAGYLKNLDSNS